MERIIVKSYKHALVLSPAQREFINNCLGQQRFLYNLCLESRAYARKLNRKPPSEYDLHKQLTELRQDPEYSWLRVVPLLVQRRGIKNFMRAIDNYYQGRAAYPQYHKRSNQESFLLVREFALGEPGVHSQYARVRVPKVGWLKVKPSHAKLKRVNQLFEGEPTSISISRDGEKYYVSITSKVTIQGPEHVQDKIQSMRQKQQAQRLSLRDNTATDDPVVSESLSALLDSELKIIGLDLGVNRSVCLSTGEYEDLPVLKPREQERLTRLQQRLAKQVKGSRNREKTKKKINRLHQKVRYRVVNAQHQISRKLVNEYDVIAIEDLKVSNMTRSAAGTVDRPGKNVAAKRGLNRSISRQSWHRFRSMLEYKADWAGKLVVPVPAQYSSLECSQCGFVSVENRPEQAVFKCGECGHESHADENAAVNVKSRAIIKLCDSVLVPPFSLIELPFTGGRPGYD